MTNKRFAFLIPFLFSMSIGFAQPNEVVNAYNFLKSGYLEEAKIAINKACLHPKTSHKTKTWRYKGDIYFAILHSANPNYTEIVQNPAEISFQAYLKTKALYKSGPSYFKHIERNISILQNSSLNYGVSHFNNKDYERAYEHFLTSVEIGEYLGKTDSLALFNCGLSAENSGQFDLAIQWYQKCIDINYQPENCCNIIVHLLKTEKRNEDARKQLSECRQSFPKSRDLLLTHLNFTLEAGDFITAEALLKEAIPLDPKNEVLHFVLGTIMDSQGQVAKAEVSYLKALELNPDYFDANYNLGANYFNRGVEINNRGNTEQDEAQAESSYKKANLLFKKALPFLEKALGLQPNNSNTLHSLKAIYATLGDSKNYDRINNLLKN